MENPPDDTRFLDLFYELYALEELIAIFESQLTDLIGKEEEKLSNSFKKKETFEIFRFYTLIQRTLPRYYWGQVLLTLWAIFESGLIEIAKEVKDQQNQIIKLNDIRGNVLERSNKYFNHIVKTPINTKDESWRHLKMFCVLRNVLAHTNGRVENLVNEKDINKIKIWAKDDIGVALTSGVLEFTSDFVKKTYSVVFRVTKDLADLVITKYPEPIKR
jgi:hypothetical protein